MSITSPIHYFGSRNDQVEDILTLINKGSTIKHHCFYDLFAGSGTISIAAIEQGIAERYVINDAFTPFAHFWVTVKENPDALITIYQHLLENYSAQDTLGQQIYYDGVQKRFNSLIGSFQNHTPLQAAEFAFLINHAQYGMPYLKKWGNEIHLCCLPSMQQEQITCNKEFAERIYALSDLFNTNQVQFLDKDFACFQDNISSDDLVILDPPYPNSEDAAENPEKYLYHRPETKISLRQKLEIFIQDLQLKKTHFLMFYAVLGLENNYPLNLINTHHLLRLSKGDNSPFGSFVENIYTSLNCNNDDLPQKILYWTKELEHHLKSKSYEEVASFIQAKLNLAT